MKNSNFFRLCAFSLLMLGALTLSVQSCNKKAETDTEEIAEEQNEANFDSDSVGNGTVDNDSKENDSEFLVAAAEMDLKEIELGKLAQQKGVDAAVKAHGKMMVDEHTAASMKLKALAAAKNISLPAGVTEDGKEAYKKLNETKTEDFDEDYIDKMVDGHKKAIEKFEDNIERTQDADVKAWAQATLPVLKMHYQHTLDLQNKLKK